jgi:hypothetical protein
MFFRLRNVTIVGFYYYYSLNCYMFRPYDHLHVEIYLLEITLINIFLPEDGRTTETCSS